MIASTTRHRTILTDELISFLEHSTSQRHLLLHQDMDHLYTSGISAIAVIQQRFQTHEQLLILLSKLFDPRYAFLIFSPLVFSLHSTSGVTLIWTTVAAEFINQILKWLLMSDRPYWSVSIVQSTI